MPADDPHENISNQNKTRTDRPKRPTANERNAPVQKNKRRGRQVSGAQIMFAGVLAIGMILGISLSSRVASSQPLREGLGEIRTEITRLELEYSDLLDDRDFALSDAYVEQWARGDGKMVRDGETLVIPVPVQGQQTQQQQVDESVILFQPETTEPEPEIWELWWALFFDSPPP